MQTSFIDSRLNSAIPHRYFPEVCTIRALVTTIDSEGETKESWSDYEGHSNIPCSVNPSANIHEVKTRELTYSMASHDISLNGYYPSITSSMKAVVDDKSYDILVPEHSGHGVITLLKCQVVRDD